MRRLLVVALLCLCASHADADEDFSGVVTRIFDGDSFLVKADGRGEVDVRLQDVDAPEKNQPHGSNARAALAALIGDRRVFVDVVGTDRYERRIARVYREADRLEIARTLVHDGHVWVYRRTLRDATLAGLEDQARVRHAGLWALPETERIPPWRFRYLERRREQASGSDRTDERAAPVR